MIENIIRIYDNAMSPEDCKKIIELFETSKDQIQAFNTASMNTISNYDNYLKESGVGDIRDEQAKERLRKKLERRKKNK